MISSSRFVELCSSIQNVRSTQEHKTKFKLMRELFERYKRLECDIKTNKQANCYPILRLMLPDLDKCRGAYNIKETAMTKYITNILALNPNGEDFMTLKKYNAAKIGGTYSRIASTIISKRYNNTGTLTIAQINSYLDDLAAKAGSDARGQENILMTLFKTTSQIEQECLIDIIFKNLKVGMGSNSVLDAFHPDARKHYTLQNNLKELCEELYDLNIHLNDLQISLFKPFHPMLSSKLDAKQFIKIIKNDREFYLEEKYDGERFQLHYDNSTIKLYSRSGKEYTKEFEANGFIKKIRSAFNNITKSIILDGEMMLWNAVHGKFGSKGQVDDVKKLKAGSANQPCFCVFDVVFVNDEPMTNKPLAERKQALNNFVTPIKHVLEVSTFKIVDNDVQQHVLNALNNSMDRKEEGIIVKDPEAKYLPAERNGWWKMKLEYFEGVMSDLDTLIIGGYYMTGSQKKKISDFLVAIYDKDTNQYLSFAKMSTGLTNEQLNKVNRKLESHWREVNNTVHEAYNICWGKQIPDVWIKPEDSICLLVRGTELIKLFGSNPDYKSHYTLRFPRILYPRFDKPYYDCLTTDELNSLTTSANIVEKLNKRHLELADIIQEHSAPKKRKSNSILQQDVAIEMQSDVLQGMEFLVLNGLDDWSNTQIEAAIRENGGDVVYKESTNTLILSGNYHRRHTSYQGECDIINAKWLRRILNNGEFDFYEPTDMIYTSEKTKMKFQNLYDAYNDPYTKLTSVGHLKKIIGNMLSNDSNKSVLIPMQKEIDNLKREMNFDEDFTNYNIFMKSIEENIGLEEGANGNEEAAILSMHAAAHSADNFLQQTTLLNQFESLSKYINFRF